MNSTLKRTRSSAGGDTPRPACGRIKARSPSPFLFAKYRYQWNNENFILYTVGPVQYILKEKKPGESELGPSAATDSLITTIGDWTFERHESHLGL